MKKYTHLLFDLDHTLWDFNTNCKLTLTELYSEYKLHKFNISPEEFHKEYLIINNELWDLYNQNKLSKEELRNYRFNKLLHLFGINNQELANELENKYLERCPKKETLIPHSIELLESIHKKFRLSIITNGFQKTQELKLKHSGLNKYFDSMFTSESVGYKKPNKHYFDFVLNDLQVDRADCLVIGDNPETDIKGATAYGIDTAWINTQGFPKHTTCSFYFKDLKTFSRLFQA